MRKKGIIWEKGKFRNVKILGKICNTWKVAKEKKKKNMSKTENLLLAI